MDHIDFSVVIPFCNKAKTLDSCLKSIMAQDLQKDQYEIICVDNNSTDDSCSIVDRYPHVKLIHEKRQGAYSARNAGILKAEGRYIVLTDADVEADNDWLSDIKYIMTKTDYDILISWHRPFGNDRMLELHSLFLAERIEMALRGRRASMLVATSSNMTVKKELFEKESYFLNLLNSEDMYFVLRCYIKKYKVGFNKHLAVKKNDIYSIKIALLKNFIYGCSKAMNIKNEFSFMERLKSMFMALSFTSIFIFRHFPTGLIVVPFTACDVIGYIFGKSGILDRKNLSAFICNCIRFVNKKEQEWHSLTGAM